MLDELTSHQVLLLRLRARQRTVQQIEAGLGQSLERQAALFEWGESEVRSVKK